MDYKSLLKEIKAKNFKPVYLLHGEEPYYIDILSKAIENEVLEEHERDFNQTIVYGKDVDVASLISEAKGYPMMAERRFVLIREAQEIKQKDFEFIENYLNNVNPTTVFVLAYKYKKYDSRTKFFKEISKVGEVFLSEKVKEYQLTNWIDAYLKSIDYLITPKASKLLADFLGNDLSRIVNELDKLSILIQKGTTINEIHIEENIGISKDFNVFELVNAIQTRDVPKAFLIVNHFEHNPKSGPLVVVIANLFGFYIKLMRTHFRGNKSDGELAGELKVPPFFIKDFTLACKLYNPTKIANNVSILAEYDLKSKGVGSSTIPEGELMREMVYRLMN
ncbi:MAG: DNA polymerase III subunit delta [Bacteroidota bacterium]